MFSTVLSAALQGLQVDFFDVEADLSNGLAMFHMVGYLSSNIFLTLVTTSSLAPKR